MHNVTAILSTKQMSERFSLKIHDIKCLAPNDKINNLN